MHLLVSVVAAVIDRYIPFADKIFDNLPHPVVWMGELISMLERNLNHEELSDESRKRNGMIMLAILLVVSFVAARFVMGIVGFFPFSWVLEGVIASVFLAHNSLKNAVMDVADALDHSLEDGREMVGHIVGRDTSNMSEDEVARAAVESLAENSSDGVIAPLFWLVLLGLPGIVLYKAINTADSMVGHRNDRYEHFGWASAKLDDLANFIPARLTALFYVVAAKLTDGANAKDAWFYAQRDAGKHASPNAGWPEAAMAGALDFALGGPRTYKGELLDLPLMGEGRRHLRSEDIDAALNLFERMALVALGLIALLALLGF